MKKQNEYGIIQSASGLGRVACAHRKNRRFTLETVSGLGNLSPRFLSEFKQGKEISKIGKTLKALRTLSYSPTPLDGTLIPDYEKPEKN